ncbi:MAG: hypothetical protein C0484_12070 [Rhodospirillum sp.]|jgi:hypothetical protein|nr:hypothetical protein [Rhodospirillum sp.]
MGDQGFAWLIFNIVLGSFFFLPTLITLLFRRDRFVLLMLALNVPALWFFDLYYALYPIMVLAILWPERSGAAKYGPTLLRPDKRQWIERQCPSCKHWIERTAESCEQCGHTVAPLDQSCPRCAEAMPPHATLCLSCGYDQRIGQAVAVPGPT